MSPKNAGFNFIRQFAKKGVSKSIAKKVTFKF